MNSAYRIKTEQTAAILCNEKDEELIRLDFVRDKKNYQRPLRGDLLARAALPSKYASVLDLTAGWARDAFVLARLGLEVLALEENSLVFELVTRALKVAEESEQLSPLKGKLQLANVDSLRYLQGLDPAERPDLIYFDPMFEDAKSKSLPKKELQVLRALTGPPDEHKTESLLKLALSRARYRVIVKRSLNAPSLGPRPHGSIRGTTVRYDIYGGQP